MNGATRLPDRRARLTGVLITLLLVGANLVALNALLSSWASARLDLTRDRMFSISPATRRLLGSLDDDLTIYGYFSKRTHPKLAPLVPQIEDLLEEYRALGHHHVRVEIADPSGNDRIEHEANERYGVSSTPFRLASKYESGIVNAYFALVIKYGDQYVRYGFEDLIQVDPTPDGDVDVHLRNLEYDLTRGIKKVVYGFRGSSELFDRVGKPVKLTAILTPATLPAQFKDTPDAVRKAAKDLETASKGRFSYEEITPADQAAQLDVVRRFGAQPMSLGLFGGSPFYLYAFLTIGDRVQPVPLTTPNLNAANLREAVEGALKRQAPGYLKTVGVYASQPTLPPEVMMQMRMQGQMPQQPPPEFEQVKTVLRQDYNVKEVSLDGSEGVPGDVDVLLVLKPKNLSDRAVYNLDQFVMRGGRLILCAGSYDPSFSQGGLSLSPISTGLDPWLKHHGVEISKTLLLDDHNQPLPIPEIRRTIFGNIQTWVMRPYPYLVEVRDAGLKERAVTAKLDAVGIYWGSPIDVQAPKELRVTPLLYSSDRSWTDDDLQKVAHVDYTVPAGTKPHLIAAALQGRFESFFKGKPAPAAPGDSIHHEVPIDTSPETRVVVVGNSEFVSDLVARALGGRQTGGMFPQNLGFVQNLIDWMNLDNDLVTIRTRAATARPIRRMNRAAEVSVEVANYLIPLAALILFGLGRYWRRRRVAPLVQTSATSAEA